MLKELHIENIAVIEQADILFAEGFNVLSGETGSGKSVIIDSVNAVLGNRTSRELVRSGAAGAVVSAVFESDVAGHWLKENDVPEGDELILKRRISSDGKSSCRVNGVPVTVAQMRELASQLVDIHGQNDGLRLLDEKSHLSFLDGFGTSTEIREEYKTEFAKLLALIKDIKALTLDESEKLRLTDSLTASIEEIEKMKLKSGEYDELVSKRDMLRNSEKLKESLDSALEYLSENEENAASMTDKAQFFASKAANISPELTEAAKLLSEALGDIAAANEILANMRTSLNFSDEEYDALENRISAINRLSRKYGLDDAGLIDYVNQCRSKLEEIEYSDETLEKLKKDYIKQKNICSEIAGRLSANRKEVAAVLEKRITKELVDLNMPSVRFAVDFAPVQNSYGFDRNGGDDVKFLMSANAGEEPGRISKIASGGELSRIMLALKNVFAENDTVETMIFDEIDSGISGIAAQRVAEKLYNVSKNRQVMCVSHLPQIASMADNEYLVSKSECDGRTYTEVTLLDENGRKSEIARMYGGDNISNTTLEAASEQLKAAREYKNEQR